MKNCLNKITKLHKMTFLSVLFNKKIDQAQIEGESDQMTKECVQLE